MQSSFVLLKSEQHSDRLQSPSGEFRLLLQECKSRAPCPAVSTEAAPRQMEGEVNKGLVVVCRCLEGAPSFSSRTKGFVRMWADAAAWVALSVVLCFLSGSVQHWEPSPPSALPPGIPSPLQPPPPTRGRGAFPPGAGCCSAPQLQEAALGDQSCVQSAHRIRKLLIINARLEFCFKSNWWSCSKFDSQLICALQL